MIEFVRAIYKRIEDVFILDAEALCNLLNQLQESIPYPFGYAELLSAEDGITEETADSFIVREPLGYGEKVILHGGNGRAGNLGGEVAHLVLAQTEVLLAILKDNFQRPTHRVNSDGLLEVQAGVGSDDAVPVGFLVALTEEQPHVTSGKLDIHRDIVVAELTAPVASVFRTVEHLGELFGCVLLTFIYILRLAHFYHAQIVALDVAGRDELDDLGTCEPTVGQHIVEVNLLLDDALDHFNHQRNLASVVLLDALGCRAVGCMFLGETCVELLLLQTVVTLLPLLTKKAEVKQHLCLAVGDAEEESFEAEHHCMCDMRIDLPDELRLDATLGIVGIVNHQTDRGVAVRRALLSGLLPQLQRDDFENPSPVVLLVGKESVENVLLAVKQAA